MHTHTTERSRAGRINVYNRQGHYERALENHHKSLDIKIRVVGHDHHTDVAGSYSNIGGVYRKLDVSSPSRTDSTRLTRGVRSPPQRLPARTSSPPRPASPPKSVSRNSRSTHWAPFKALRRRYAGSRNEQQLQLHLPQKHKATEQDSTLRVEMNGLEDQADNAKPRELWWKPLSWLGTLRPTTANDSTAFVARDSPVHVR